MVSLPFHIAWFVTFDGESLRSIYMRIRITATRPDMYGMIIDPTGSVFSNIEEFDYGQGCEE